MPAVYELFYFYWIVLGNGVNDENYLSLDKQFLAQIFENQSNSLSQFIEASTAEKVYNFQIQLSAENAAFIHSHSEEHPTNDDDKIDNTGDGSMDDVSVHDESEAQAPNLPKINYSADVFGDENDKAKRIKKKKLGL